MATLAYAIRTEQREDSPSGTSESTGKPGSSTWIDAMAALVPAEVLAAHAFILTLTTKTTDTPGDEDVTTITDPGLLKGVFWALLALAAALYVIKKIKSFHGWDYARAVLPAAAFVLWSMLTPSSAFDAQFDWDGNARIAIAVIGAILVAAIAKALGVKADRE